VYTGTYIDMYIHICIYVRKEQLPSFVVALKVAKMRCVRLSKLQQHSAFF